MSIRLANAPVSWGVDYADDPQNPPWRKVMSEIAEAGYRCTELGPYGYYPTDPGRLRHEFERRSLGVTAGFVFQMLHEPSQASRPRGCDPPVKLLAAVGGKYLVTIDHLSDERMPRPAGRIWPSGSTARGSGT